MQQKIELKQIRTFNEIIDDSISFFKQNFKPLLRTVATICGFFIVAGLIIAIFSQIQTWQHVREGTSFFTVTYLINIVFHIMSHVVLVLTGLSFMALYHDNNKTAPTVTQVWSYVKYYALRVLGSALALTVLVCGETLFCILPGIYFGIVYMLVLPVMVFENGTLGYSLKTSFRLIKKNWWHVLGVVLVTGLIVTAIIFLVVIPAMLIVMLVQMITTVDILHVYNIVTVIAGEVSSFFYLIPIIAIALTYFSLNELYDDNNLMERINNLGRADASPDIEDLPSEEY